MKRFLPALTLLSILMLNCSAMEASPAAVPDMNDSDNDGISNYRELTIYHTDPNNPDTDGDGVSDLFEVCASSDSGTSESPSIGSDVYYNLNLPELSGKLKFLGKLPAGLSYDPDSGYLSGQLTGKPGVYVIKAQLKDASGAVKTLSLSYTIASFPSGYAGTYQVLIKPQSTSSLQTGFMELTVTDRGTWTAVLMETGRKGATQLKGDVTLDNRNNVVTLTAFFPSRPDEEISYFYVDIQRGNVLVSGYATWGYNLSPIKGFRLAKKGELEMPDTVLNFVFDSGYSYRNTVPEGYGWASGPLTASTGKISLSGQLGDAQPFKATVKVSATGYAILWAQPYGGSPGSYFGGFLDLRDLVRGEISVKIDEEPIRWYTEARPTSKSYPSGFGPTNVSVRVSSYSPVLTADALTTSLGLSSRKMGFYCDTWGSFSDEVEPQAVPSTMALADDFSLVAQRFDDRSFLPWSGKVNRKDGSFQGSFTLSPFLAGFPYTSGKAKVSGVMMQQHPYDSTIGYGLIQIPIEGSKGSFRTAPVELSDSE